MPLSSYVFYLFALIIICSAGFIIVTKNVLHAAISLLCALISIAGIYVFAGADFLAIAQIMIYIGGIIILILFGIMLTIRGDQAEIVTENRSLFVGLLTGTIVLGGLISFISKLNIAKVRTLPQLPQNYNTVPTLGKGFMTTYLLPFEIAAILLLLALIGAAFIAKKSTEKI